MPAPVSRRYVRGQAANVAKLGESAGRAAAKAVDGVDDWDEAAMAVAEVCGAYARMSAGMTARYYDGIRQASRVRTRYSAGAFHGYDADATYSAAIAILESVQDGTATKPAADLLGNLASREVKNAADRCIRENVRRDPAKPRYAIVPDGDACAFCQMRASLGYTYADEDAVESHDHCTCTATPVFGGQKVEGYDPDAYYDRYKDARDALDSGDISDELKAKIDAQREAKGRDFDKTKAILMVMRDRQGIA